VVGTVGVLQLAGWGKNLATSCRIRGWSPTSACRSNQEAQDEVHAVAALSPRLRPPGGHTRVRPGDGGVGEAERGAPGGERAGLRRRPRARRRRHDPRRLTGRRGWGTIRGMSPQPINLGQALASFDEIYSPRIVARMNDYDVRIAKARGDHVWHVHEDTDEFFLVLEGRFDISLRTAEGEERTVELREGDTFVVPRGTEHKPSSPGAAVLMFEPSGTSTTGDRHEGVIPDHVDSTTGHAL